MLKALKNNLQSREAQLVFGIFAVALILRLIGINHGFPFIFHPDEPAVVRSATGIRFDPNPAHFDWPHLHFYLNYFVYFLFIKARGLVQVLGLQTGLGKVFPLLWQDPLVFYFISRVFDAFLGALTIVPIFLAGRLLFNKRVGLLSALALSILPFHVHTSHFALIDVPTMFWISWALYFSARAYKNLRTNDFVLAGFFVGFAAATKYNGGLTAVMVALVYLVLLLEKRVSWRTLQSYLKPVWAGLAAIAGFILGMPYALLDYETFSRTDGPVGAFWQFSNVGSVGFIPRLQQFFSALFFSLASDLGYVFSFLFLGYIFYALFRLFKKDYKHLIILGTGLFLIFYTSGFAKVRSHYFIPAYPFIILGAGFFVDLLLKRIKKQFRGISLLVLFAVPFVLSVQADILLAKKDTKVLLYEWLTEHVTPLDHLVYNSSSIKEVVEKDFKDVSNKGIEKDNLANTRGYVIIYTDAPSNFTPSLNEEAAALADYERIYEISSENRRGNAILIYAFNETKEN